MHTSREGGLLHLVGRATSIFMVRFATNWGGIRGSGGHCTAHIGDLQPPDVDFFFKCYDFVRLGAKSLPSLQQSAFVADLASQSLLYGNDTPPIACAGASNCTVMSVVFLPGGVPFTGWFSGEHHPSSLIEVCQSAFRASPAFVRYSAAWEMDLALSGFGDGIGMQFLRPDAVVCTRDIRAHCTIHLRTLEFATRTDSSREALLIRLSLGNFSCHKVTDILEDDIRTLSRTPAGAMCIMRMMVVDTPTTYSRLLDTLPNIADTVPSDLRALWDGVQVLLSGAVKETATSSVLIAGGFLGQVHRFLLAPLQASEVPVMQGAIWDTVHLLLDELRSEEAVSLAQSFLVPQIDQEVVSAPGEVGLLDECFFSPKSKSTTKYDKEEPKKYVFLGLGLDAKQYLTDLLTASDMLCAAFGVGDGEPPGGGRRQTLWNLRHSLRVSITRRFMVATPSKLWDCRTSRHRAFPFLNAVLLSLRTNRRIVILRPAKNRGEGPGLAEAKLQTLSLLFPSLTPTVLYGEAVATEEGAYQVKGTLSCFGEEVTLAFTVSEQVYSTIGEVARECNYPLEGVGLICTDEACTDVFPLHAVPLGIAL